MKRALHEKTTDYKVAKWYACPTYYLVGFTPERRSIAEPPDGTVDEMYSTIECWRSSLHGTMHLGSVHSLEREAHANAIPRGLPRQ